MSFRHPEMPIQVSISTRVSPYDEPELVGVGRHQEAPVPGKGLSDQVEKEDHAFEP